MLRTIAYGMGLLFSGFATLFSLLVYGGKYLEEYLQGYQAGQYNGHRYHSQGLENGRMSSVRESVEY